jgi:SNF2 family DNA or RNA helicase
MEEKILQKQLRKGELEKLVVDDGGDSTRRNFSSTDLKACAAGAGHGASCRCNC